MIDLHEKAGGVQQNYMSEKEEHSFTLLPCTTPTPLKKRTSSQVLFYIARTVSLLLNLNDIPIDTTERATIIHTTPGQSH